MSLCVPATSVATGGVCCDMLCRDASERDWFDCTAVHLRTSGWRVPYTPSSRFVNRNYCFCLPARPAPRGGTKSRAEAPHTTCAAIKKRECWRLECLSRFRMPEGSPRACQTLLLHFALPAHLSPAKCRGGVWVLRLVPGLF